jgi:hypothetical protein
MTVTNGSESSINNLTDSLRQFWTQDNIVLEQIYMDLQHMADRISNKHSFVLILNSSLTFSNMPFMIDHIRTNGYRILDKFLIERNTYLLPQAINEYIDYYIDYAYVAYK